MSDFEVFLAKFEISLSTNIIKNAFENLVSAGSLCSGLVSDWAIFDEDVPRPKNHQYFVTR